jgi:menaquinone-dependent protoporphyrinogen IX oxidase
MKVLVIAGSRHGSTSELADSIGAELRTRGHDVEAESDRAEISELVAALDVHEHRVFAGELDRDKLSLIERTTVRAVKVPYGDFRDWDEVRAWADEISDELAARPG